MIIDQLRNFLPYHQAPCWTTIHDFLTSLGPDTPDGEVELDGQRLFARIMSYETVTAEKSIVECHRCYADIQMPLIGAEGFRRYTTSTLTTKTPYNPDTDAEFFDIPDHHGIPFDLQVGDFTVLFPQDAHMPMLRVNATAQHIKKVVVKVHLDLLTA